jgi:adenosylcobinamide-GDP ribazoletransferase
MTTLLSAFQFLTAIPISLKKVNDKQMAASMIFFPVVGLVLGLLMAGAHMLLSATSLSPGAINIILVVGLIAITGGMHLDGLADTADAFLSGKNKEEMLLIMRDPHIGVMGTLGIISAILLKIALLTGLNNNSKAAALILMMVLSRWSAVLLMQASPYARAEGKAKTFTKGITPSIALFCTGITLACAIALGPLKGISAMAMVAAITYAFGKYSCRRINGITGDIIGCTIELTEIAALAVCWFVP